MNAAVAKFLSLREPIMAMVDERKNGRFVEDFFETLEDERDFRREILDDCR